MHLTTKNCSFQSPLKLLALALVLILLPSCGTTEQQDDSLRIGVALYAQDDTFISAVTQNLEWLAQEAEGAASDYLRLQEIYRERESVEDELARRYAEWERLAAELEDAKGA